jgi:transposase
LKRETERLRRELEAALRASKRQAAPHSRGNSKANPKRPGRKPGRHYGRQACRPTPLRVDEQIAVPLPEHCPHCGGGVERESCETQYQEEIVRRTIVRRFDIAVGCCRQCQRRVQGRHPLQTSDAVSVGNVQLGPEALTLAAILNKQMGLSLGHTRQVLSYGFGLEVSRGGLYRALARMADRATTMPRTCSGRWAMNSASSRTAACMGESSLVPKTRPKEPERSVKPTCGSTTIKPVD